MTGTALRTLAYAWVLLEAWVRFEPDHHPGQMTLLVERVVKHEQCLPLGFHAGPDSPEMLAPGDRPSDPQVDRRRAAA